MKEFEQSLIENVDKSMNKRIVKPTKQKTQQEKEEEAAKQMEELKASEEENSNSILRLNTEVDVSHHELNSPTESENEIIKTLK